jgi:multicomponent Na+:H+ antiporter subunit E
MTAGPVLVPVRESGTLRNTVAYVCERALESGDWNALHFAYPLNRPIGESANADDARELLEQVEVWVEEDLGERTADVEVHTSVVGKSDYLFHAGDYAAVLERYARSHGIESVVLDPEFNPDGMTPLLPPLEFELEETGLDVEIAPVERPTRRSPIPRRAGIGQFGVIFCWSYAFYLLVGGTLTPFNLATGALVGVVVAGALWRISTMGEANPLRLTARLGRMALFAPYLLWEIVQSNLHIAYVVLHPDLPIDPEMVEYDAALFSELQVTTLANSITLTPGTLTVDVTRRHFEVHSLTPSSREGLFTGNLERAVRFVFYGRPGARIPSPVETSGGESGTGEEETEESDG